MNKKGIRNIDKEPMNMSYVIYFNILLHILKCNLFEYQTENYIFDMYYNV